MSKIFLKTPAEIAIMAEGGEKLAGVINKVLKEITPGISTLEIDSRIEKEILNSRGKPSFKMVPRYFWSSCVGVNDEVVHSIPKKDKIVKEGDLLKIDAGVYWKGFHTDASWTILIQNSKLPSLPRLRRAGKTQNNGEIFLEAGRRALKEAIKAAKRGNRVGDISLAIEETIRKAGYFPVEILTGHGIGRKLHEEPLIPCFLAGRKQTIELKAGMVLAIEVIYTLNKTDLVLDKDDWTIATKDGKISGLFEETVAIGENGPLVLTKVKQT